MIVKWVYNGESFTKHYARRLDAVRWQRYLASFGIRSDLEVSQ